MSLMVKDSWDSSNDENTPLGNQQAVCSFVYDIGTHEGSYNGKPTQNHQCIIGWELSETRTKGDYAGQPFVVYKYYTLSLNSKANLRKDLEAWRGLAFTKDELAGFDIEKLIGANCLLNLIKYQKEGASNYYAKVASISPLVKNMEKMNVVNSEVPDWVINKQKQSIEYQNELTNNNDEPLPDESNYVDNGDEDLPF